MQLSEEQAKEILDFLIHKANPSAKWQIISWYDKFVLQVQSYKGSNLIYTGMLRRSNSGAICKSCSSSCIDMLTMLIDEASQSSIVHYSRTVEYIIIPQMTTLEQILIDMDLSANV